MTLDFAVHYAADRKWHPILNRKGEVRRFTQAAANAYAQKYRKKFGMTHAGPIGQPITFEPFQWEPREPFPKREPGWSATLRNAGIVMVRLGGHDANWGTGEDRYF